MARARTILNKQTISVILISLYSLLFLSNTLFAHSHTVGSSVVSHSHPYSQSRTHDHSATEFQFYAMLSLLSTIVGGSLVLGLFFNQLSLLLSRYSVKFIETYAGFSDSLRAPPFVY